MTAIDVNSNNDLLVDFCVEEETSIRYISTFDECSISNRFVALFESIKSLIIIGIPLIEFANAELTKKLLSCKTGTFKLFSLLKSSITIMFIMLNNLFTNLQIYVKL